MMAIVRSNEEKRLVCMYMHMIEGQRSRDTACVI